MRTQLDFQNEEPPQSIDFLDLFSYLTDQPPESMENVNAEPKPGTTLNVVLQEHKCLDEFMEMMEARLELDRKHLVGLKALRRLASPEWAKSRVWPLISPLLDYLTSEIAQLEIANQDLELKLADIPPVTPLNEYGEGASSPLVMTKDIERTYQEHNGCHDDISKPDSIEELRAWLARDNWRLGKFYRGAQVDPLLPSKDCDYRRAVVKHQEMVRKARSQMDKLPTILEHHQQHAEDIKTFLRRSFHIYGDMILNVSNSRSTAVQLTEKFSSLEFIAPHYDAVDQERDHILLRDVDYHNYYLDGRISRPLINLGMDETLVLIEQILSKNTNLGLTSVPKWEPDWISTVFELESSAINEEVGDILKTYDVSKLSLIFNGTLLYSPPLIPLPKDVGNTTRRAELASLLHRILPVPAARREILGLALRMTCMPPRISTEDGPRPRNLIAIATRLTHRPEAAPLLSDILRKWDIRNDCPLPEGVERQWNEIEPQVVWKKTGRRYIG